MTDRERKKLDRFIKHVNRKLNRIQRNITLRDSLHELEVAALKGKIAKLSKKRARGVTP